MELESFIGHLKKDPSFTSHVTFWGVSPRKKPEFKSIPQDIHPVLRERLNEVGIDKLYSHQEEAYCKIVEGNDVIITTPTASGKSLAYNLPILDGLLKDNDAKALYLFPTKALSQDQIKVVSDFSLSNVKLYIYDGDTPSSIRQAARKNGRLIVTNPDMLHTGILPNHPKWVKIFDGLKYIVIDELHNYRGVFGSHLALIIRRLLRIASFYGSKPLFIATSATIDNPEEIFYKITTRRPYIINKSGAPMGERHYIIYNPPIVDHALGIRRGIILETSGVAKRFIKEGIPTIVFAKSRMNTEVILSYLKKWIPTKSREIAGYRGGYLPGERREIETGLKNGRIKAVVATNALELGIDIGGLDVSIMAGYPGTVASFYQQSGRCGRKERISLAILVASNSPLDQYIAAHPEYLIERNPEAALINPKNIFILVDQVKCAAFELPFRENDYFVDQEIGDILSFLEEKEVLHREKNIYHWQDRSYPAENVSIRSADNGNFVIIELGENGRRVIGEMDRSSVPFLLYENAIYIHGSQQYMVSKLDWNNKVAYVEKSKVNYYTDSESKTDIKILEHEEHDLREMYETWLSEVLVRTMAVKYKKIKFGTHENIGWGEINLPAIEMHTQSLVIAFNDELFKGYSKEKTENLLLSISNLLRNISPLYIMTDVRDIGSAEALKQPLTGCPTIFIYDRYPGGVGLAGRLFDVKDSLLNAALQRVKECSCIDGCPSCVGPNRMNKKETIDVLEHLIEKNIKLVN